MDRGDYSERSETLDKRQAGLRHGRNLPRFRTFVVVHLPILGSPFLNATFGAWSSWSGSFPVGLILFAAPVDFLAAGGYEAVRTEQ